MIGLGDLGREQLVRAVAVAARTDVAAHVDVDFAALLTETAQEDHRVAVDAIERSGVVAETGAPVGVRPPGRRLQHQPGSRAGGELEVVAEVLGEQLASPRVVQERERGEVGQVDVAVEGEPGLQPAVGEDRVRHLWLRRLDHRALNCTDTSVGFTSAR